MDLFEAIKGRRSCRAFLSDPIEKETILKILRAGTWAPSPLNAQPWEFVVVTNQELKERIFLEGERCKNWGLEVSGWKWLGKYRVDFLKSAPVLIVVIGDPNKTGLDLYMEGGRVGYQHGCAAAIQNMHLAAHALGLGSLWYTLYDKEEIRKILDIPPDKDPLAIVVLGKPSQEPPTPPRKELEKKVRFLS
ncbi:MAG TPA: nitroreductase family protein [Desulfobacterales bacterium]|nr:nitroreductase family protein [Desulfobacterales bacterium]